jgi:hypothetical protein
MRFLEKNNLLIYSKFQLIILLIITSCTTVLIAAGKKKPVIEPKKLDITLGAPFCDNAVLQRNMELPIWGWSPAGTEVTIEFAGQKKTTKAGNDGKWLSKLNPLKASFEPREMIISESTGKKVTLKNILVGEVWMASGQSNMQWTCTKSSSRNIKVKPYGPNNINPIREFGISSVTSQLHPIKKATGLWKDGEYLNYSAVAFAFAAKVYKEINVPIGILNCSFSQTAIEAWVPREGWASGSDKHSKDINTKCLITDPSTTEHKEAWNTFYKSLEDQIVNSKNNIKQGKKASKISAVVPGNMKGNRDANWLFNGRLSPVIPYAIRGAIWNQGYANMGKGISYYNNLHSLIRGWREVWNKPELPVYFHQFYCPGSSSKPGIGSTEEMRLGTWMARDIPNTGMASQIDISGSIHYHNKAVPGQRLALHALKNQYGKKVVTDGPMFKSYSISGDKVTINFTDAKEGLVVADTSFNRSRTEGATGFADPKIIANGEDKVNLFWLVGEDRIWHPATFKIEGETVIVTSKGVKKPKGVSYGSGGIGFQACLYNKSLLPMTPFIQYDNKMVTSKTWPDEKLKIAGEVIDPNSVGLLSSYSKLPILSVQYRDNAIFQADKPVVIWGSTRLYGDWQDNDEEGDCKIHFEFGSIKKVIPVTPAMAEWRVTLPPMKADGKKHTLKVQFTINGELAHERIAKNIVFGDVWYVAAPSNTSNKGKGKKKKSDKADTVGSSTSIIRMIENQSKRGGNSKPSRFSICVSRTPRVVMPNGKATNRFASYWKPAKGMAQQIGEAIHAKTKRPVGIIWMKTKGSETTLSEWMSPNSLKHSPSTMKDYKTVGSQYPDNPYYLENVKRYMNDWKSYWKDYIPEMINTKEIPVGAKWGASWGSYPSPKPAIGDTKATLVHNIYVAPFAPTTVNGMIFLTSESMVKESNGANFGTEMSALANCLKSDLGGDNSTFIYTIPSKSLAEDISIPKKITGNSKAIEIQDWNDLNGVLDAL